MKLIFCMQINIKFATSWFQHFQYQRYLQGDTVITDECNQAFSQNTQNDKFAVSLQYLKREVRD